MVLNDALPVIAVTEEKDSFKIDPQLLKNKLSDKTKALILNSPSNPTGLAYDRRSLEAIADLAIRHDFYIISDEIYEKLTYEGFGHISIASLSNEINQRTIVVNGLSKSHAMTGWRLVLPPAQGHHPGDDQHPESVYIKSNFNNTESRCRGVDRASGFYP